MSTCLARQSDIENRLAQLKLAEKLSTHSFGNRDCFTETASVEPLAHSYERGAVLWKLVEKSLALFL